MSQDILQTEQAIEQKEREFHGKDDHLGLTLMTFPQYISATRSTMFTNHLKQFNVLNQPEFPYVFTNYENIFGKNSSSLQLADHDYKVVARIEKFKDYPGHLYCLFIYDEDDDKYDVIFRKVSENLTEKYGYLINNESLDKLEIGDEISRGDVLYKSTSFDEDNNYCFGLNARIAYIEDPGNVEDAYVVSESFAKRCISHKCDSVKISLNDNDFLLNLYGDGKQYKGLPDINEEVDHHIICAKRRIYNDQVLYDMKKSNMMKISPMSDKLYFARGYVIDIDIYCNKPLDKIPIVDYNDQLVYYLKNQNRYYKELFEQCDKIVKSGSKYSADIGFMHQRAKNILDPKYQWKDNESIFSNMIIEVQVDRDISLSAGSKITGRYGDKGVISEVRPDDMMPYVLNPDGSHTPLDVIANPLSCPNRLNPFQWIEMSITHQAGLLIRDYIKPAKSITEKWKYLRKFLSYFNERGELDQLEDYYKGLNLKGKHDFWDSVENDGIFINYPPMWEGMPAIDKIEQIGKAFNFQRDEVHVFMHGRDVQLMRPITVGYKYMMKLKQDSEKNFSARSTGSLSQQGLPEKSNKVRTNEMLYSNTPIAIGRDENNNLAIGVESFMLNKMHLFYRTSPFARRKVGDLYTNDVLNFKGFKIKPGYRNRNVEILNAKLKAIGAEIHYCFDGVRVNTDDGNVHQYKFKDKVYLTTKEEMRNILLDDLMWQNFNKKKHKGTRKQIQKKFEKFKRRELERAKGNVVVTTDDDE